MTSYGQLICAADTKIGKVFSDPSWTLLGFGRLPDRFDKKIISRLKIRDRPTAGKLFKVLESSPPKDARIATMWFEFLAEKGGERFIGIGATILTDQAFSFLSRRI